MIDTELLTQYGGRDVRLYTIHDGQASVSVMDYGAAVTSIIVPDRWGVADEVVLAPSSVSDYFASRTFYGFTIGRYANRIKNGAFAIDGRTYFVECNEPPNSLHGGFGGFDTALWYSDIVDDSTVEMRHVSPDGDCGFPGRLDVAVTFSFSGGALSIKYRAVSDKDTIVNLTNHSYFNLAGGKRNILNNVLTINARSFTPIDAQCIPTGELRPVAGTPFDFTQPHTVGSRIHDDCEQLRNGGGGYDHNFVLDAPGLAATVMCPESGRVLETYTDMPGIQLYTANDMDVPGRGCRYGRHFGLCLETQFFPDSPNHDGFPSCILRAGEVYSHETIYKFSVCE